MEHLGGEMRNLERGRSAGSGMSMLNLVSKLQVAVRIELLSCDAASETVFCTASSYYYNFKQFQILPSFGPKPGSKLHVRLQPWSLASVPWLLHTCLLKHMGTAPGAVSAAWPLPH